MKNRRGIPALIPAAALIAVTGCSAVQAAQVPRAVSPAQVNAHARAVMARCVADHPPVSLAALQAQVTCAVPQAYRTAAAQCITLALAGARDAFTTRQRITQVYAEECMAGSQ